MNNILRNLDVIFVKKTIKQIKKFQFFILVQLCFLTIKKKQLRLTNAVRTLETLFFRPCSLVLLFSSLIFDSNL